MVQNVALQSRKSHNILTSKPFFITKNIKISVDWTHKNCFRFPKRNKNTKIIANSIKSCTKSDLAQQKLNYPDKIRWLRLEIRDLNKREKFFFPIQLLFSRLLFSNRIKSSICGYFSEELLGLKLSVPFKQLLDEMKSLKQKKVSTGKND